MLEIRRFCFLVHCIHPLSLSLFLFLSLSSSNHPMSIPQHVYFTRTLSLCISLSFPLVVFLSLCLSLSLSISLSLSLFLQSPDVNPTTCVFYSYSIAQSRYVFMPLSIFFLFASSLSLPLFVSLTLIRCSSLAIFLLITRSSFYQVSIFSAFSYMDLTSSLDKGHTKFFFHSH